MSERESEVENQVLECLASLRQQSVSEPPDLPTRLIARVRLELLRRDLLDFFAGAPVRVVRQLLGREATRPGPGAEEPPPDPGM